MDRAALSMVLAMPGVVFAESPSVELAATLKADKQVKVARVWRGAKRSRSRKAGKLRVEAVRALGGVFRLGICGGC